GASIVYNIVARARLSRASLQRVSYAGMAFGLLAGVLMLAIGNMGGIYQLIGQVNPNFGNQIIGWINSMHFAGSAQIEQFVARPSSVGFDFWGPSRIIHQTINEFPYWSFLFAALHPHVI